MRKFHVSSEKLVFLFMILLLLLLSSLLESFVPFGGFFSSPEALKNNTSRRSSLNEISNEGLLMSPSVADNYRSNLPSWLQMSELVSSTGGSLDTKVSMCLFSPMLSFKDSCYNYKSVCMFF